MARVGIIGSGWWATSRMMPDLQSIPGCELVALVEPEPGRRAEVAERFGIPPSSAFGDVDALLAEQDELRLDGCAVFSPHVEHCANALPCLESGLHVLVEKPLTVSTAERNAASDARALAAAAEAAGVALLVNTPMNYGNACERACELVAAGRVGNIEHIACHMEGPLRDLMAGEPMAETADQVYRPPASTWADPSRAGGCKLVALSRFICRALFLLT